MAVEGVDYSFARPNPARLYAAGKRFACRYLSYDTAKNLSAGERNALIGAGVAIVVGWEATAGGAKGGRAVGIEHARVALQQAYALGVPEDRPIYFSVDWDASTADLVGPVASYFQGVASVLGLDRTGAYGGIRTIDFLLDRKLITWAWQTYAWSGGKWDARAHIQQYHNGVNVAGGDGDLDRAMTTDYGQWGIDMPISKADLEAIADYLATDKEFLAAVGKAPWAADVVPAALPPVNNPDFAPDPADPTKGNKTWAAGNALHDAVQKGRENAAAIAALSGGVAIPAPGTGGKGSFIIEFDTGPVAPVADPEHGA